MAKKKKSKVSKASRVVAVVLEDNAGGFTLSPLEKAETSTRLKDPKTWWTVNKLVEPPYPPEALAQLPRKCTFHRRCCKQIASDTAGLGYTLRPVEPEKEGEEQKPPEDMVEFLRKPNTDFLSLRKTLEAGQFDFESVGWCAFELVRTRGGNPQELWHIPAYTIRIHREKDRFAQMRNNKKVWFKPFGVKKDGEDYQVDKDTGEIKEGLSRKQQANELIFLRNYDPDEDYYGIPDIISSLGSINLLLGIVNYRLDFFENNAVPSWAVVITGGEFDEEVKEKVEEHLKEIKGVKGAHSTLVLSSDDPEVKIDFVRLQDKALEGSFSKMKKEERDEVIVAHGIPGHRIGISEVGALGGNLAREATRVYKYSIIQPRQEDLENVLTEILSLFTGGVRKWLFKFAEIDLTDEILDAKLSRMLLETGAITPNQIIQRLGLGATFEGGDNRIVSRQLVSINDLLAPPPKKKEQRKESKTDKVPADEKTDSEKDEKKDRERTDAE